LVKNNRCASAIKTRTEKRIDLGLIPPTGGQNKDPRQDQTFSLLRCYFEQIHNVSVLHLFVVICRIIMHCFRITLLDYATLVCYIYLTLFALLEMPFLILNLFNFFCFVCVFFFFFLAIICMFMLCSLFPFLLLYAYNWLLFSVEV